MIASEYSPKLDDFAGQPWKAIIEGSQEKTCSAYGTLFCGKIKDEPDPARKNVWLFFCRVTSFYLSLDAAEEGGFAEAAAAFSDDELNIMKALTAEIEDSELKARIADIIWTRQRKGNFDFAKTAIVSYLDSARRLEDPENWVEGEQRTQRACRLAFSLRIPELRQQAIDHVKGVLERCNGDDPYFLSARMMQILLAQREGDPAKYVSLATKLAESAEQNADFFRAREIWDIVAAWQQLAGDGDAARLATIAGAETYVKEAERCRQKPGAPYMHASLNLASAIEAFRKIEGTQDRVAELHRLLIEYQQKSVSEYPRIESGPIDLSDMAAKAIAMVKGKSFHDALLALSMILRPASVASIREQAKDRVKRNFLSSMFATTLTNAMGRTVARQPSLFNSSGEEAENELIFEMFNASSLRWQLNAHGLIEPARDQIMSEYQPRIRDFLPLVSDNLFVPPGREMLYARGLHAGMTGDFVTATHLLIPQVEHSIRILLYRSDFIASGIDPEGIQREFDLNTTLKNSRFKSALEQIFGEDTVFELRALLVEQAGANLRNEMAHGLLNFGDFYTLNVIYFWWMTLRLCCIPTIAHLQNEKTTEEPGDISSD